MSKSICIILCTYNGEEFLQSQIESIQGQTFQNWELYIRDDDSSDSSVNVILSLAEEDQRIHLIEDQMGNLGAAGNFSYLMKYVVGTGFQYYCFADQDDIWGQNKLETLMESICSMEKQHSDLPILVYSDLEVVDEKLESIAPSFMRYQNIHHEGNGPLKVLLAQNFVTGCSVLVNCQLFKLALLVPEEALMHDWWLALCAATFGKIGYVNNPLVKYRQHERNEIGAKSFKSFLNPFKTNWFGYWLQGRDNLVQSMHQARVLAERIKKHDPENNNLELIEAYSDLLTESPVNRLIKLNALGIHAQSNFRQALLLSRLLFSGSSKG